MWLQHSPNSSRQHSRNLPKWSSDTAAGCLDLSTSIELNHILVANVKAERLVKGKHTPLLNTETHTSCRNSYKFRRAILKMHHLRPDAVVLGRWLTLLWR